MTAPTAAAVPVRPMAAISATHSGDSMTPPTLAPLEAVLSGAARRCALSRATSWQGWTLPERTMVNPVPSVRAVRLTINTPTRLDMPLESPVVGLLPASVMVNDDGSPSGAGYERDVPHLVAGQRLADDVRWHYDPATYGMGRERPPVAVSGFVHPPDGAGRAGVRRHVVLPWDGPSTEKRKRHGDVQR